MKQVSFDFHTNTKTPLIISADQLMQGDPVHVDAFLRELDNFGEHPNPANGKKRVTSVQCMVPDTEKTARNWAVTYFHWLQKSSGGIIRTTIPTDGQTSFRLMLTQNALLSMLERSFIHVNLSSWTIEGGVLNRDAGKSPYGGFHFLTVRHKNRQLLFTALTGFAPRLPWPLYRITQGVIHPVVMNRFAHAIGHPYPVITRQ